MPTAIIGTPVPPDLAFGLCAVCEDPTTLMCQNCAQWVCAVHGTLNVVRMKHGHGFAADCFQPGRKPAPVPDRPLWVITWTDPSDGAVYVWCLTDHPGDANAAYWRAVRSNVEGSVTFRIADPNTEPYLWRLAFPTAPKPLEIEP